MSSPFGDATPAVSPANLDELVEKLEQRVTAQRAGRRTELLAEDLSGSVPGSAEPPD
jgi:hypothetical protein